MFTTFYDEPQGAPRKDPPDTLNLLVGRYITNVELGTFNTHSFMDDCEKPQARLTLDNGIQLVAIGHSGGCACGQGDFEFTKAFYQGSPTARIMNATVEMEGYDWWDGDISATTFKVFVIVDDEKLPLLEFEGFEGDGYYGRGFWLTAYPSEE